MTRGERIAVAAIALLGLFWLGARMFGPCGLSAGQAPRWCL